MGIGIVRIGFEDLGELFQGPFRLPLLFEDKPQTKPGVRMTRREFERSGELSPSACVVVKTQRRDAQVDVSFGPVGEGPDHLLEFAGRLPVVVLLQMADAEVVVMDDVFQVRSGRDLRLQEPGGQLPFSASASRQSQRQKETAEESQARFQEAAPRRRTRPACSPVSRPSQTAGFPLTNTRSIPSG